MKGKVIGGKVLVKEIKPEEKTKGGIYKPATQKRNQLEGEIVSTGADAEVKVGERIIFIKHIGVKFTIDDEEFILINEKDILFRYQ